LDYAVALAGRLGAKIHLLHVTAPCFAPAELPTPVEDERAVQAAIDKLKVLVKQTVDPAVLGMALVRTGSPDQEIVRTARELKVDLIVLARHGQTGPKHRIIGPTADRVVGQAHCAVLIVPTPQQEFL
jgi:nucleotide-binding universal stress UspA family protein